MGLAKPPGRDGHEAGRHPEPELPGPCLPATPRNGGRGEVAASPGRHLLPGRKGHNGRVTRVVHVPYTVKQDEDGVWCAAAMLRPGVGALGDGSTRDEAITDLRAGLLLLIEEVGIPDELSLDLG